MSSRWQIINNGIEWDVERDTRVPHEDHLEMNGLLASLIVNYGVSGEGSLVLRRHVVWPTLRTIPNNTHASFQVDIAEEQLPVFAIDGQRVIERPVHIRFDGVLTITSRVAPDMETVRELFPAVDSRAALERITVINHGQQSRILTVRNGVVPPAGRGCTGVYVVSSLVEPVGELPLAPGESRVFGLVFSARRANEPYEGLNADAELLRRRARVVEITAPLVLETGIPEIDTAFRFAKLHAGESIFRTRTGLMHGPGGRNYYAATWCNDEVEYAGPWFAFTGDSIALEASLTAYRHYMPFMGPDFTQHIPSSVIAEGLDIWEGRGDRGDAAMYAYGASRFALVCGDRNLASELWPGIEWTLEYCRRKLTPDGVVASDTDELEGRLPAGKTNLNTSSLYYGGLRAAAALAASLELPDAQRRYSAQADTLEACIEVFFGTDMHGFRTYRYHDGNEVLRSWICTPLCMGILTRAPGTIDAMFSPYLWTENGMLSQEGDRIFWDRSALYGFRGGLIAGATEQVFSKLREYSANRLLGEHVPYPIEAWPEGGQRHLSAESALYCRVIAEGLFGIEPMGLQSLRITPRIPGGCREISLRNIRAFGTQFDIVADTASVRVEREGRTVWTGQAGEVLSLAAGQA